MKPNLIPSNMMIYQEALFEVSDDNLENYAVTGGFEKSILIITDIIQEESEEHILLNKMLSATKIELKDIYLLQLSVPNLSPLFISKLKAKKVISFGTFLDNPSLRFSSSAYRLQDVNNIQFLTINKLSQIKDSSEMKQALWNGLKKMFNV
jgi:hypothetical protein